MDATHGPIDSVPPTIASLWAEVSGGEITDQGLDWPADVFALVGTVLSRTHAYRFAVSPPPGHRWPPLAGDAWNAAVCGAAVEWAAWAERPEGPPPGLVDRAWSVLRDGAGETLEDVAEGRAWPVCEALLTLLAVSDETGAGVAAARDPVRTAGYRYGARADELLARRGSLSRLPTHRLRVLPKVRTPPGGISFRSLSRYLCLRGPAVDVTWNRVPARRSGLGQQQANVLLLPWPLRIRQRDFFPLWNTVRRTEDEPFGTFQFSPAEPFDLDLAERVLRAALDEVDAVDAVVLPETSVPVDALEPLESLLRRYGVGVLLAGAREPDDASERSPGNWVHLGVRVGDSWSHYRQNKHHRWFLDASQINQYHLAGALHPSVRWWEAMEVSRRGLQFLELSEGLTLVAVVCEDLARLDEVAELIRDVGPTLVVTILLDGPQLASRWTARYASVLADDPGSAVLTLSAAGMVRRSRPSGTSPSSVVALWKDPTRGLREISLDPGTHGVLISLAATPARRRSADGRRPVDNSTGLMVAGVHALTALPEGTPSATGGGPGTAAALDPLDLTIVTAWAGAVAASLEHAPGRVDELVADAGAGAAWRPQLGLPEPSATLSRALAALADALGGAGSLGNGEREAAVLDRLRTDSVDPDAPVALARTILCSALEARLDARVGRSGR